MNADDDTRLFPARMAQRFVEKLRCRCPNKGIGCEAIIRVLDVEHHLGSECEWREEECDQCHQRVRRAQMGRHKDTTCARKPMACGFAGLGCETCCPQGDLAAHERDGVVAHVGLLMQRLAATSADLTRTREELAATRADLDQTKTDLAQTKTQLAGTSADLTRTREELAQTQHNLAEQTADLVGTKGQLDEVRARLDQFLTTPAVPEGLQASWDPTVAQTIISWQPATVPAARVVPAAACAAPQPAPVPVRYRVEAMRDGQSPAVVYTGPECRCTWAFPPDQVEARFVVVAVRGLVESEPSAPVSCTRPDIVFTYQHDMDEQGLFYYLGTQGRTQPWQNPAQAGWVTVTRSSESTGNVSDALGRQPCNNFTDNLPNSWYQVDLGAGRLFAPTRYTLRHSNGPSYAEARLQSWRLEGSLDGASWRTLDEHTNEPNSLPARPDAMATFTVAPAQAFPARHFRVLMTGTSPRGWHHLMLSGLEMYGTLIRQQQQ
ncbi:putative E3 ubiquitin-protein ligase HECTD1 [Paratrimastix pyriformis]|uniref:E3 ubiquitin-protein ligase HECTD1 n=1 Tax=Paratrimastix pyriformis TaxID=342808 RepID=A0ABQ8UB54_9EUKA|nr:putative E3 ubiquitin-protein ligase HECTD1 [Paratrimastix pyriformis]